MDWIAIYIIIPLLAIVYLIIIFNGKSASNHKISASGFFINSALMFMIGMALIESSYDNSENIFTDFRTYLSILPFLASLNFLILFVEYVWKIYVKKEEKY
jgi:hypothetical protein